MAYYLSHNWCLVLRHNKEWQRYHIGISLGEFLLDGFATNVTRVDTICDQKILICFCSKCKNPSRKPGGVR
jgi:hypothetical protein